MLWAAEGCLGKAREAIVLRAVDELSVFDMQPCLSGNDPLRSLSFGLEPLSELIERTAREMHFIADDLFLADPPNCVGDDTVPAPAAAEAALSLSSITAALKTEFESETT